MANKKTSLFQRILHGNFSKVRSVVRPAKKRVRRSSKWFMKHYRYSER